MLDHRRPDLAALEVEAVGNRNQTLIQSIRIPSFTTSGQKDVSTKVAGSNRLHRLSYIGDKNEF